MNLYSHPIIAISTPLGYSGIGIIRISGNNLWIIINKIFKKNKKNLKPKYATYTTIRNINNEILDYGIIIFFKSPNSYTGEDILEIYCHGNPTIIKLIFSNCLKIGKKINLKIANPGEFTQRAFLNKKIDLIQVEAIADLIKASTEKCTKFATKLLSGKFSLLINKIQKKIKKLRIIIETILNFPEEKISINYKKNKIHKKLIKIHFFLKKIFKNISYREILRNGLNILIIGKPNVGKSSLLNILNNKNIAIVTNLSGTTRDKITTTIEIEGISLYLTDTAGLQNLENKKKINKIEKIGILKTLKEIKKADIILYVIDITKGLSLEDKINIKKIPLETKKFFIWNKIDILKKNSKILKLNNTHIFLSIKKNKGINLLKSEFKKLVNFKNESIQKYIIHKKQLIILQKIKKYLKSAIFRTNKNNNFVDVNDLLAEDLKIIQINLNKITGKNQSEKILKNIFSKFCVGK